MDKDPHYAIVTSYIEGRPPSTSAPNDRMLCQRVLNKINNLGIRHNDPRLPNFIIVEKNKHFDVRNDFIGIEPQAIILDFGCSEICSFQQKEPLRY